MSPPSSLSRFPPELLIKTFENFCDHCNDDHEQPWHPPFCLVGRGHLLNLCRTSKQMSAIATPILYHSLPSLDVNKACRLLSTIFSKPYLADNIYEVKFELGGWYSERSRGQQRLLNAVFEQLELDPWDPYSADASEDRDGSDYDSEAEDDDEDDEEDGAKKGNDDTILVLDAEARAEDERVIGRSCTSVMRELLTRAQNLQALELTKAPPGDDAGMSDDEEMGGDDEGAWLRLIADPTALANLRHLGISHWDTEGGFEFNLSEPTLDTFVLAAATNLERLTLQQCDIITLDRDLPNLTVVNLFNCILANDDLEGLVARLPALQDFGYHSGGAVVSYDDEEHTPDEVASTLRRRSSTLTRLLLDYSSSVVQESDPIPLGSFSDFPVLEAMELWAGDVWVGEASEPETERLVSILPRSLKQLEIRGSCPATECVALASAAAAGRFPALEEVKFGHVLGRPATDQPSYPKMKTDEDVWVPVRDSFTALKIKCSLDPDW